MAEVGVRVDAGDDEIGGIDKAEEGEGDAVGRRAVC